MFPVVLNFHREFWNPVKKNSEALVFFAVSKQIPIVYSADRGRAEINIKDVTVRTLDLLSYPYIKTLQWRRGLKINPLK